MSTVLHCLVSWILAECWLMFALVTAISLAFGNFVVASQSFKAQGFEQTPLAEVPFLGLVAQAVGLGSVSVAELYAVVLTLGMNFIVIVSLKLLGRGIQEFFDYRQVSRSPDPAVHARQTDCLDMLVKTGCWLILSLLVAVLTVRFDVAQFELRLNTLYLNVTDPGEMLEWSSAATERLGRFLAPFGTVASLGYLGLILGVPIGMEYAFVRCGERWLILGNAIRQAREPGQRREPREFSASVSPAAEELPSARPAPDRAAEQPTGTPVVGGSPQASRPTPPRAPENVAGPATPVESTETVPPEAGPEAEVIVGPGESRRMPVVEIDAHPEDYVRDGSGRVWFTRLYYDQVMGRETLGERQS
jgi:hypothetical protein